MDQIVEGLPAVAIHFGKSLRQVQRWARAGMPALSRKQYDLGQVRLWLQGRRRVKKTLPPGAGPLDFDWGGANLHGDLVQLLEGGTQEIRRGLVTVSAALQVATREEREKILQKILLQVLGDLKTLLFLLKAWGHKSPTLPGII